MQKIVKQTVADQVFKQLSEKIVSGEWPQGYHLPGEVEIADALGVSRVSVRTAIQKMQTYGMVRTKAGEGTFVEQVSMASFLSQLYSINALPFDYVQINQMKSGLEQLAIEIICLKKTTKAQIKQLRKMIDNLMEKAQKDDFEDYLTADLDFHRTVIAMTENDLLIMIYDAIIENIKKVSSMNTAFALERDGKSSLEGLRLKHSIVVDAIEAQDQQLALELFNDHNRSYMKNAKAKGLGD